MSHSYGLLGAFSTIEAARKAGQVFRHTWPEEGTTIHACDLDPASPTNDRVMEIHSGRLGHHISTGTVRIYGTKLGT